MTLVPVAPPDFDLDINLAYAGLDNFTSRPVYRPDAGAWLVEEAADKLARAIQYARQQNLRFVLYDAFRPSEAQWTLWNHTPDPEFLADPRRGSPHSRGIAVDLSLRPVDGAVLDMGTAFDAFYPPSHHGHPDISMEANRNRYTLLGIMISAGWDFYRNEWWHYQLADSSRYPVIPDGHQIEAMLPTEVLPIKASTSPSSQSASFVKG